MPDNATGALTGGIGRLRWLVTLYRRDQEPGPNHAIRETLVAIRNVHADIQPTYPTTYYNSMQVDSPITHLVRMRWIDYVETTHVVMRSTIRPNDESIRTELFRVRRAKEVGGRKRFIELECELEQAQTTDGDTDQERQERFAEQGAIEEEANQ